MDFRSDADAVITGDGELVVQHPVGWGRAGLSTQVGGEGMKVSHVTVSQQEVVTGTIHIMSNLRRSRRRRATVREGNTHTH